MPKQLSEARVDLGDGWAISLAGMGRETHLRHDCWRASSDTSLPPAGNDCGIKAGICLMEEDGLFHCYKCDIVSPQEVADIAALMITAKGWK